MPRKIRALVALAFAALALTACDNESLSEYRLRLSIECHEAGGSPEWKREGADVPYMDCAFPEVKQ